MGTLCVSAHFFCKPGHSSIKKSYLQGREGVGDEPEPSKRSARGLKAWWKYSEKHKAWGQGQGNVVGVFRTCREPE